PAVAHYNTYGDKTGENGIWVHRQVAGAWKATRVSTDLIGEQLGFAVGPDGRYALAYYDREEAFLVYLESLDGETWSRTIVDDIGDTGRHPSLAFDGLGRPAIAYYHCSRRLDGVCGVDEDGLMLARRIDDKWSSRAVHAEASTVDGYYPALTFAAGKAVIAFQTQAFDPRTSTSSYQLMLATEE
ncbi:MAG: hypothetical protein V2A73_18860, partial [Pseudomonadota bacterium]